MNVTFPSCSTIILDIYLTLPSLETFEHTQDYKQ